MLGQKAAQLVVPFSTSSTDDERLLHILHNSATSFAAVRQVYTEARVKEMRLVGRMHPGFVRCGLEMQSL